MKREGLEAERVMLGCMLLEAEYIAQAHAMEIKAVDFGHRSHALIFGAILALADGSVDAVTVSEHLAGTGKLAEAGGYEYLDSLYQGIPRLTNFGHYAGVVIEAARRRRLRALAHQILSKADGDLDEALNHAQSGIDGLRANRGAPGMVSFKKAQAAAWRHYEDVRSDPEKAWGIRCGFRGLDDVQFGFHPGDQIIIAARPTMGKTAFALTIAEYIAKRYGGVEFVTMEMRALQLQHRLNAMRTGIGLGNLLKGTLRDDERSRLERSMDDQLGLTYHENLNDLNGICHRMALVAKHRPVNAIFIDYLGLLSGGRAENKTQEITAITRRLKLLAGEIGCPLFLLSQLNRACETRQNKRPQLSDLRESGSIEQDADMVLFLYRDWYYRAKSGDPEPNNQDVEILNLKSRNGPTGTYKLRFIKNLTRFEAPPWELSSPPKG